jgi:hypothetical protein
MGAWEHGRYASGRGGEELTRGHRGRGMKQTRGVLLTRRRGDTGTRCEADAGTRGRGVNQTRGVLLTRGRGDTGTR